MKFCYDCDHYRPVSQIVGPRACVGSQEIDLVSGASVHQRADVMRQSDGDCGPDAKMFRRRPVGEFDA